MPASSNPSSSTSSEDVKKGLTQIRDAARTIATGSLELATDAERALNAVTWAEQAGAVKSFPPVYATVLARTVSDLAGGQFRISSAQSTIQLVVSGSTSSALASGPAAISTNPFFKAPSFQHVSSQQELDTLLTATSGSSALAERRRGAWATLQLATPESCAQACHSGREVLTGLLDHLAPNELVKGAKWWTAEPNTADGVSKRQKIKYLVVCHDAGALAEELLGELETQFDRAMKAHKAAIMIAHHQETATYEAAKSVLIDLEALTLTLLRQRRSLGRCPQWVAA